MARKRGVSCKTHTKQQLDDYANQNNPNNKAYIGNMQNRKFQKSKKYHGFYYEPHYDFNRYYE